MRTLLEENRLHNATVGARLRKDKENERVDIGKEREGSLKVASVKMEEPNSPFR